MQLSGGPYSYNRFDAYEKSLGEGKDASGPHKMKAKVDADGVKTKAKGGGIEPGAKQPDEMDEAYKGRHGQSEKEYQDGRSMAGKMISGDSKGSGANYSYKAKNTGPNPAGGSQRPQGQARMNNKDRAYLQMQKGSMKKEELNNEETTDNVMENNQRMAMYSRALGVMGAHYSGPGFGVSPIEEKMADKDHDGDGKVESSKEEYFGSKDKAIKKAMAKEEYVDEGLAAAAGAAAKALAPAAKGMVKSAGKQAASTAATTAGNRAGSAIGNIGSKGSSVDSRDVRVEEVSITKEMVVEYLVLEGYASNEVSAEILHTHVSDEFLADIERSLAEDYVVEGDAAPGVSGDEAMKRHGIKPHEGTMKVQKLKPRKMRKGEGLGVGARKRQGVGKVSPANPDGGHGEKLN